MLGATLPHMVEEGGVMNWLQGVLIIVGFFVLRLGVPLAITLTFGHLLRRLEVKPYVDTQAQQ
jgi:hypothetical protein